MRHLMTPILLVLTVSSLAYAQSEWPYEIFCTNHDTPSAWLSNEMELNPVTGNPAVVMAEVPFPCTNAIVYYHERIGENTWTCEPVMTTDWAGQHSVLAEVDLAFDSNGNPGILLVSVNGGYYLPGWDKFVAKYAWKANGSWHTQQLILCDCAASGGKLSCSLSFDENDRACIVYSHWWSNPLPQYGGGHYLNIANSASAPVMPPVNIGPGPDGRYPNELAGASSGGTHTIMCAFQPAEAQRPIYQLEVTVNPGSPITETHTYGSAGFTGTERVFLSGRMSDGTLHFLYGAGTCNYRTRNASGLWSDPVAEQAGINFRDIAAGGYGPYAIDWQTHGPSNWEDLITLYTWENSWVTVDWLQWPVPVRDGLPYLDNADAVPDIALDPVTEKPWFLYQNRVFWGFHRTNACIILYDGDTHGVIPVAKRSLVMYCRLDVAPYTLLPSPTYTPDNTLASTTISYFPDLPAEPAGYHYFIVANADGYEEGYMSLNPWKIGADGRSHLLELNLYKDGCGRREGGVQATGGPVRFLLPALFGGALIFAYVPYWRKKQRALESK